jgi:hypothetical protein
MRVCVKCGGERGEGTTRCWARGCGDTTPYRECPDSEGALPVAPDRPAPPTGKAVFCPQCGFSFRPPAAKKEHGGGHSPEQQAGHAAHSLAHIAGWGLVAQAAAQLGAAAMTALVRATANSVLTCPKCKSTFLPLSDGDKS